MRRPATALLIGLLSVTAHANRVANRAPSVPALAGLIWQGHEMGTNPWANDKLNVTAAQYAPYVQDAANRGLSFIAFDFYNAGGSDRDLAQSIATYGGGTVTIALEMAVTSSADAAAIDTELNAIDAIDSTIYRKIDGKYLIAAYGIGDTTGWVSNSARITHSIYREINTNLASGSAANIHTQFTTSALDPVDCIGSWYFKTNIATQANLIDWFADEAAQVGWTAPELAAHTKKDASVNLVFFESAMLERGNSQYLESWGFTRAKAQLDRIVARAADLKMVELTTFNDVAEAHGMQEGVGNGEPMTRTFWDQLNSRVPLQHEGWRDFLSYYVSWAATGVAPTVTTNQLLVSYRLQSLDGADYFSASDTLKAGAREYAPSFYTKALLSGIYRRDGVPTGTWTASAGTSNNDSQGGNSGLPGYASDGMHVVTRVKAADAPVTLKASIAGGSFVTVQSGIAAGQTSIDIPGSITFATGQTDLGYGTSRYAYGTDQLGQWRFQLMRESDSVVLADWQMPIGILETSIPGGNRDISFSWAANRVYVAINGAYPGAYYLQGTGNTLTARVGGDLGSIASVSFYDGATLIGTDTTLPYTTTWTPSAYGNHDVKATITRNDATTKDSETYAVFVHSTPTTHTIASQTFTSEDVMGNTSVDGSSAYSAGVLTVTGGGASGTSSTYAMPCRFMHLHVSGDCTLIARIASVTGAAGYGGPVIGQCEDTDGRTPFRMMEIASNFGGVWQKRDCDDTGGRHTGTTGSSVAAPYWVRLQRTGSDANGFGGTWTLDSSPDGTTWTNRSSGGGKYDFGAEVGLGANGGATVTFDNISFSQP